MKVRHKFGPGDTKCEPCAVNEVDADTYTMVSGEPWCKECYDMHAGMCETCDELFEASDLDHGHDGESTCYDCAHAE